MFRGSVMPLFRNSFRKLARTIFFWKFILGFLQKLLQVFFQGFLGNYSDPILFVVTFSNYFRAVSNKYLSNYNIFNYSKYLLVEISLKICSEYLQKVPMFFQVLYQKLLKQNPSFCLQDVFFFKKFTTW